MAMRTLKSSPSLPCPLYARSAIAMLPGASAGCHSCPGRGGNIYRRFELALPPNVRASPTRRSRAYAKVMAGFLLGRPPFPPPIRTYWPSPLPHGRRWPPASFPFGAVGLVHIENQIHPAQANSRLWRRWRSGLRPHPARVSPAWGRRFALLSEALVSGELVWEGRQPDTEAGGAARITRLDPPRCPGAAHPGLRETIWLALAGGSPPASPASFRACPGSSPAGGGSGATSGDFGPPGGPVQAVVEPRGPARNGVLPGDPRSPLTPPWSGDRKPDPYVFAGRQRRSAFPGAIAHGHVDEGALPGRPLESRSARRVQRPRFASRKADPAARARGASKRGAKARRIDFAVRELQESGSPSSKGQAAHLEGPATRAGPRQGGTQVSGF